MTTRALTLTFVATEERYSEYRTTDGSEVYLAHGTAQRLLPLDELDLHGLWRGFLITHSQWDHTEFRALLSSLAIDDPETVDEEVGFCKDCLDPDRTEDQYTIGGGGGVCEKCSDSYYFCSDCDERWRYTTTTLANTEICDSCRGSNYSHCDECDGYYPDHDAGNHEHPDEDDDEGCTCEAPARSFTIRNDGEPPLANDTRATVMLPAGVISEEGIGEIASYLRSYCLGFDPEQRDPYWQLAYRLSELGETWQTRQGNFTKRLSRFAYKEFGIKVDPEVVSRVGCIARDHSTAVDFEIEVTRDLNLSPEEFCHADSCWWQSYFASRCALKSNGGFGLRSFHPDGWVTGRAWVLPIRETDGGNLTPTFETREPDAFVVFNGYGNLSGYTAARIMTHLAGMTYRKIAFSCSPMYVNNQDGYLVAREEIASRYTDGSLCWSVETHSNLFTNERVLSYA